MTPRQILQEHDRLCDDVHQCVLAENRFLRLHQRPFDAAMIERKTALRSRLDDSLEALRKLPAGSGRDPESRALLERTRSRILQVLQMDRENEQLLLRCSLSTSRVTPPVPGTSLLQHIYRAPEPPQGPERPGAPRLGAPAREGGHVKKVSEGS